MSLNNAKTQQSHKPQEPVKPYPYREQEVSYHNTSANIVLSGTLTMPQKQGCYPAVLLISGMGPVNRNGESYYGHKTLLVLADHLTRNGIAVLRVDKRGVGASTGKYDLTVTPQDLAQDACAGVEYLKTCAEIDSHQIGLIGHSEGGLVATMVANELQDIAWIILMSGAVVNSTEGLIEQCSVQLRADGASPAMIKYDGDIREQVLNVLKLDKKTDEIAEQLRILFVRYWAQLPEDLKSESARLPWAFSQSNAEGLFAFMNSAYYRSILIYDSAKALEHITVPLLALCGEFDFMAPHTVFPLINAVMKRAGNKNYMAQELPKLNHSFQTCATGSMAEYATIEETIAPIALDIMCQWILARITKNS